MPTNWLSATRDIKSALPRRGDAVPDQDPHWNYHQGGRGLEHRNYTVTCLVEGMKKCVVKPFSYDKVREVTGKR